MVAVVIIFFIFFIMSLIINMIKKNNKQYVYHVKFVSETIAGINTISTDNVKGLIYDLSGRRVENPTHGIYIQDGKKFIVK